MNRDAPRAGPPGRIARALASGLALATVLCLSCGARHGAESAPAPTPATDDAGASHPPGTVTAGTTPEPATSPRELDMLPVLAQGSLDAAGPIVDFGEPQADPFLLPPLPLRSETLNGDSWATVGPRVRVRVTVDPAQPPTLLRLRVRRVHARAVLAVIDGVPSRQVALPHAAIASVVSVPLLAERFRREISDVELRFIGVERTGPIPSGPRDRARPVVSTQTRRVTVTVRGRRRVVTRTVVRRTPAGESAPTAALDLDWIHLVHGDDVAVVRVNDLIADVRADGPPRRALTLYSPTRLSVVTVIPPAARFHAAFAAEGIRGRTRPSTVRARVRIEADGVGTIERDMTITAGSHWRDLDMDLGAVAGHTTRLTFAALDGGDTRLAMAEPRITSRSSVPPTPPRAVRRVAVIVIRGARYDRFAPVVSPHFTAGGFARLAREGLLARAVAPAPRELAAFASAVTGLPADVHGMIEDTDTLDETAPTVAATLRDAGVATAAFSDDAWFLGSGIDRGFTERQTCANEAATCRVETLFQRAADWLVAQGDRRAFVMVATRACVPPLDPPPDLLTAIDPSTDETQLSPEGTGPLANRSRHGALNLDPRSLRRLEALYDASLAGVDRGVAHLLDRLRDANQLASTAIVVVGDRGTALGESGLVGDGPMTLAVVSHTVLLVRTPGGIPTQLGDTVSVLDGVATAMERIDAVSASPDDPVADGPRSVFTPEPGGLHPRGVVVVGSLRGDPGLRFGGLLAVTRGGGPLALFEPEVDPLGQHDVAIDHPIAQAFADRVLARHRAALAAGERASESPPRAPGTADSIERPVGAVRRYAPSTRPLPPNVEAWLRSTGQLAR